MKRKLFAALLVGVVMAFMVPVANAHEYDSDDDDMWLRYVAYAVHPVGVAIEYAVLRPIHCLVSKPCWSVWFGHEVSEDCGYDCCVCPCDESD